MSDLRNVPGIGAKKEQELLDLGYGSLRQIHETKKQIIYFKERRGKS